MAAGISIPAMNEHPEMPVREHLRNGIGSAVSRRVGRSMEGRPSLSVSGLDTRRLPCAGRVSTIVGRTYVIST
jgi:hypothetical protein